MNEPHRQLLLRYPDGQLGPEEESQLAELLRSDRTSREFLRDVAEQAVVVADMQRSELCRRDETDGRLAPASGDRDADGGIGRLVSRRTRWQWVVAAALVLVAAVYFLRPNEESAVATVTDFSGALRWTGDGGQVMSDLQIGGSLGGGTIESLSPDSWVGIEFRDGSTVTIAGQSVLTISQHERKELFLRRGRLSARVTRQPAGKPMLVHTPAAELEVLGTQFNVEAENSATTLAVNEGLVRLKRLTDGKVIEVPAQHRAHTSIDDQNGLVVTSRDSTTHTWRSDLARDATCGKCASDLQSLGAKLKKAVISGTMTEEEATAKYKAAANFGDETDILYATPWLMKHSKSGTAADVLYIAAMSVRRGQNVPVVLDVRSRLRVQGRLQSSVPVTFGMTTRVPDAGFVDKYSTTRTIEFSESGENFDIELPVSEFRTEAGKTKAIKKPSLTSLTGLELVEWWCFTTHKKAGLAIAHVELLAPASVP